MNLKILISNLNLSKLNISERKVPYGCGFGLVSCQLLSSALNCFIKDGPMKITTDIKDHHHLCIQMRMILQILKISLSSKLHNTTNGGMLVFLRDRNFFINFSYMKIQDGKKIYFKHAGVNQPTEVP